MADRSTREWRRSALQAQQRSQLRRALGAGRERRQRSRLAFARFVVCMLAIVLAWVLVVALAEGLATIGGVWLS